jgi:parallel beta-helix repeat protein
MEQAKMKTIKGSVALLAFFCLLASIVEAATVTVDCSSASLQAAIDKAKSGDTFLVSGTCNENLVVPEDLLRISLDGQGKATINGRDKTKDTLLVLGRAITIKGLTISGGRDGIHVLGGATALVDRNTIQNTGRFGIYVTQHSSARIVNSTIQNTPHNAISVSGGSFAYIGFLGYLDLMDKTASPNTIQNSGRSGIHVHRNAYGRIAGNTIKNNKENGIEVLGVSHAQIGSNTIDGNGGSGIFVSENSQVNLGSAKGTGILDVPNATATPNAGFGVRCSMNSSAAGRLGSLTGTKGAKDFASGCGDSLIP